MAEMRHSFFGLVLSLAACDGGHRDARPTPVAAAPVAPSPLASAATPPLPADANTMRASPPVAVALSAAEVVTAKMQLADPDPRTRDAAAAGLRATVAADPARLGDRGEAAWKQRLAEIKPGTSSAQFARTLGATSEGDASGGGGTTNVFRLDDFWTVEAYFSDPGDKLTGVGALQHRLRYRWVDPPKDFSGHWLTYFVNGAPSHDIDYAHGAYTRFAAYHDTGQLAYEQRYVNGRIDGDEVGYHPSGARAYEIHHRAGKSVGLWRHWFPNGKLETEQTYVNGELDGTSTTYREDGTKSVQFDYKAGKETGQAAWDEHGTLLYAHGTAAKP